MIDHSRAVWLRGYFELSNLLVFVSCFYGIYFEFLDWILLWFPKGFSSFLIYAVDEEYDQSFKGKLTYYSHDCNGQIISYLHQIRQPISCELNLYFFIPGGLKCFLQRISSILNSNLFDNTYYLSQTIGWLI